MNVDESLEEVEKALFELKELNRTIPIIVEGKKDKKTLQKFGLKGNIIIFNRGSSLTDFCDNIASKYSEVIILTDWDRRGGALCRRMRELLKGRVKYNVEFRGQLGKNAMVRTVEGLYSWIETMKSKNKEE